MLRDLLSYVDRRDSWKKKKNKYVVRTGDVNLPCDSIMYIFIYLSYKMRKDFVLQIDYWKIHRTLAFLDISRKP